MEGHDRNLKYEQKKKGYKEKNKLEVKIAKDILIKKKILDAIKNMMIKRVKIAQVSLTMCLLGLIGRHRYFVIHLTGDRTPGN